jgi:hypothetical protein
MHIGKATQGEERTALVSNIVIPQVLHTNFNMNFTSLPFTTLLDNFNTLIFPSFHHINQFPKPIITFPTP